jgi:hypothetical protein
MNNACLSENEMEPNVVPVEQTAFNGSNIDTNNPYATETGKHSNEETSNNTDKQIDYPNGDVYRGSVNTQTGLPSGSGAYTSSLSGDFIEGEFAHGSFHGIGGAQRTNGDTFAGRFSRDHLENGTYSYGGTDENCRDTSVPQKSHAIRYRGAFRENLPNGSGTLEFSNGDVYEGAFELGKAHGTGRYATPSGDIIAGLFENGRPIKGMRLSAAGHKYLGQFHPTMGKGRFHGLGRLQFSNGEYFEGSFVDGRFHGEGKYTFSDGMTIRCSSWDSDEPTGFTEVTLPDGSCFVGSFFSSRRKLMEGRGVMKFSDGSWFEARSFRRIGRMPTDYEGGAFYSKRKAESKSWISLQSGTTLKEEKLWLVFGGSRSLGLQFSSAAPKRTELTDTNAARLILATHQHLQFTVNSMGVNGSDVAWVSLEDGEENSRVQTTLVSVQGVLLGDAMRAFCLIGPFGGESAANSDETLGNSALEQAVRYGSKTPILVTFGASCDEGKSVLFASSINPDLKSSANKQDELQTVLSTEILALVAKQRPDLIIIRLVTGYAAASICQWLISELIRIQTRLVVAWVDGNAKDVVSSATACSSIVYELLK